jgi:hypothetical protein
MLFQLAKPLMMNFLATHFEATPCEAMHFEAMHVATHVATHFEATPCVAKLRLAKLRSAHLLLRCLELHFFSSTSFADVWDSVVPTRL